MIANKFPTLGRETSAGAESLSNVNRTEVTIAVSTLRNRAPCVTVRFLERHGHMISHVTPDRHLYISFTSSLCLSSLLLDFKKY